MSTVLEIIRQFGKKTPDKAIRLTGAPKYSDLVRDGVGRYYHDPAKAVPDRIHYE